MCQGVLDGRRKMDDWALSVVVPIFKGKGYAIKMHGVWVSEVARAGNEDSKKSARDEIAAYGKSV